MDKIDIKRLEFELKKDGEVTVHAKTDTYITFKKGEHTFSFHDLAEAHQWLQRAQ